MINCDQTRRRRRRKVWRCSGLLGDDGDGNSLSDGLDVITVDRVSGTLLLQPEHIHHSNTDRLHLNAPSHINDAGAAEKVERFIKEGKKCESSNSWNSIMAVFLQDVKGFNFLTFGFSQDNKEQLNPKKSIQSEKI